MKQSVERELSVKEAFALLAHWRSASTKLSLFLADFSVSFKGTVRVLKADFPLTVRFTWLFDGTDNDDESLGASLVGAEVLTETLPSPTLPHSLVCRCKSGARFILCEMPEGKDFEDFILESALEQ